MQIVPSLEAARSAILAGATHLQSPPYAACHAGVNYYRTFLTQLQKEFPKNPFIFTLCCGDNPSIAHDALRLGFMSILCDCHPTMMAKLQAIAKETGATVHRNDPTANPFLSA